MTFPTGVINIRKCSDEELKTMLDEAREASKHSRRLGKVMGIVAAHHLEHMREFLAYQQLATWTSCLQISNLQESRSTWKSGAAMRRPRFR